MYRESIERTGLMLYFRLPRAAFISCKKTLFEHAISMQELFSQILDLLDKRDPRVMSILEHAKSNPIANNRKPLVFTNPNAIYSALKRLSPLKNKAEDTN